MPMILHNGKTMVDKMMTKNMQVARVYANKDGTNMQEACG